VEQLNQIMQEILDLLRLKNIPNLGDITIKKLINHVGSAQGVFKEKEAHLLKIDGISKSKIKSLHDPIHIQNAENELQFVQKEHIKIQKYTDDDYPKRLKECIDSPVILFSSGTINFQDQPVISIVGTRNITSYGTQFCEKLVEDLKPFNPIIVSGYAYGVDITAHKAAIKHNLQTVACLGHGLNQIYPKSHKKYMSSMEENGGFFTDFWSTDAFKPQNFLRRNRIIAGMSQATIVIESADKGGSLVTAQLANSYYRDVFAVPGRINDKYSMGCNMLIKSQQAHMLTSIADLVYILNWEAKAKKQTKPVQTNLFLDLPPNEEKIFKHLSVQGKSDLDSIALNTQIPTYQIASMLLNLELKGVVRPLPGKQFELV